jgi:Na+/H+-translocating membrane pyrophosphatase
MAATPGVGGGPAAEVVGVLRAVTDAHLHLRQRLVAIGVVTFAVAIVCSVLAYFLERHGPQTEIHSLWDGFFWASTQLLTVSSSMKNPVTTGGQILDLFMEAYAITVVASLAGSFGAFFHKRSQERSA